MLVSKKAQGMIVDLILLVMIVSLFFLILSNQSNEQSINTASMRSESEFTQKLLITAINSNSSYGNATVGELVSMNYCGENLKDEINKSVTNAMDYLNKPEYYFIFSTCPDGNCNDNPVAVCTKGVKEKYGACCVTSNEIIIATMNLTLPQECSHNFVVVSLGVFPSSLKVEPC